MSDKNGTYLKLYLGEEYSRQNKQKELTGALAATE